MLPHFDHLLDPRLARQFTPLCQPLAPGQAQELAAQVAAHLEEARAALRHNEFLDLGVAEQIAGQLGGLLGEVEAYSPAGQALIAGAARYFIRSQDAQADLDSVLGFDDDVAVLNYVLVELGRPELKIEL